MSRFFLGFAVLLLSCQTAAQAADPVFSGPQIGEKLPPLKAKGVFGDLAGKEFDLIEQSKGKSVALIFVHARTRPAFGLTNTIMKYAATRKSAGLESSVIFLTDDLTKTEKWMNVVQKHFPKGVTHGISTDGPEGPGAYGLNRNVTLTILVGKQNKVTANFALVQPSLQADGPKILQAIVAVSGGGKVPKIADIAGPRYRRQPRKRPPAGGDDPNLRPLLRAVIDKQASEEEVKKAAAAVEKYVSNNEKARKQLGRIANTVVNSGKLSNYGTQAAQKILRDWAKKYPKPKPPQPRKDDTNKQK